MDERKERIFIAWREFETALDGKTGQVLREKRDELIRDLLEKAEMPVNVTGFLQVFREDYRAWRARDDNA